MRFNLPEHLRAKGVTFGTDDITIITYPIEGDWQLEYGVTYQAVLKNGKAYIEPVPVEDNVMSAEGENYYYNDEEYTHHDTMEELIKLFRDYDPMSVEEANVLDDENLTQAMLEYERVRKADQDNILRLVGLIEYDLIDEVLGRYMVMKQISGNIQELRTALNKYWSTYS